MRSEFRYVLHLWRDAPRSDAWRARLEELATRDVKHFANLADLADHLLATALSTDAALPENEETEREGP